MCVVYTSEKYDHIVHVLPQPVPGAYIHTAVHPVHISDTVQLYLFVSTLEEGTDLRFC